MNAKDQRPNAVDDTGAYTQAIEYDGSDNPLYVGKADPGTAQGVIGWQIKKITYSGSNATDVQWAEGDANFDKVWDDRASYSYS